VIAQKNRLIGLKNENRKRLLVLSRILLRHCIDSINNSVINIYSLVLWYFQNYIGGNMAASTINDCTEKVIQTTQDILFNDYIPKNQDYYINAEWDDEELQVRIEYILSIQKQLVAAKGHLDKLYKSTTGEIIRRSHKK
jgi:hypothetical protein